jgi:HK97 family phage portal protein
MRYVYDARAYALDEVKASMRRGMFTPALVSMAERASWDSGTVDSAQAEKLAITSSWVWSDISLLADRVAGEPWQVKQRQAEELEDVENHAFEMLWQNPGGTYSGALIAKYLVWWYLLRGEAFLFVATDAPGRGEPKELWPLVAGNVEPQPKTLRASVLTGRPLIDYTYTVGGEPKLLPGENVVHFRFPNPWDYWRGLSPLTAAAQGIELDTGARRWQRDFYRVDNAVPVALVQTHPDINNDDFESLVADIKTQIAAGSRMLFGRSGDLNIQTVQQTIQDMQVLETREFVQNEIDRIYHVPSGIFDGGSSGDAQQAMEISLARNAVQPLLDYFAAELTFKIAPYYGEDIVIAAPDVVPQDRALQAQEYTIYRAERSLDENRAEQNLDELTGKDSLNKITVAGVPITRVPLRILDLVQAGVLSVKDETEPEPVTPPQLLPFTGQDNPPAEDEDNEPPEGEQPPEESEQPPSMAGSEAPSQEMANLTRAAWLGVETEIGRWERVALKELREGRDPSERAFETDVIPSDLAESIKAALVLADTEAQVKAAFSPPFAYSKATRITAGGKKDPDADDKDYYESRFGRIWRVNLNGQLQRIIERLGDPPDLSRLDSEFWTADDQEVIRVIRPELERMALDAAETTMRLLPVGFEWGLVADDAAQWAAQYAGQLISRIDHTTQQYVARKVRQYIETSGMTIGDLTDSLAPQFGPVRAEMIAVTEVTSAYSAGHNIAADRARQAGMVLEDIWHTNRDELVCPVCAPNDGKRKSEGWTVADVPAHIRCRCWKTSTWTVENTNA